MFSFRAFCATVKGEKGDMKGKNIQLKIKKLPHEINIDKSYYEVNSARNLFYAESFVRNLTTDCSQGFVTCTFIPLPSDK